MGHHTKSILFSHTNDCKELHVYLSLAQFPSIYPLDPTIPHSYYSSLPIEKYIVNGQHAGVTCMSKVRKVV